MKVAKWLAQMLIILTATIASPLAQGREGGQELSSLYAAVAERLHKAASARTRSARQQAFSDVARLLSRLPSSPVAQRLREKLQEAEQVGIGTQRATEALKEAVEIAQTAVRLLQPCPLVVDPVAAQATLQQVLNSAEFRKWELLSRWLKLAVKWLEPLANLLLRVFQWVWRWLLPVLRWLSNVLEALALWFWGWLKALLAISPWLAWGMVGAAAMGIGGLLLFFLRRWFKKRQQVLVGKAVVEALAMPERLLREAEQAAAFGDYLTALRKAYRALLLTLDRMGLIRFREQRTNWEYLAEMRKKAPSGLLQRFQTATQIFDRCFYARQPVTPREFGFLRECALVVRDELSRSLQREGVSGR